jgi:hypothetical protein
LLKLQPQGASDAAPEAAPDGGDGAGKTLLLLESGIRFHTMAFMREKAEQPSNVCAKFRLHLRGRRLVEVRQLGADRIVVFTFGAPRPRERCHTRVGISLGLRLSAAHCAPRRLNTRRLGRGGTPPDPGAVRGGQHHPD